MDALQPEGPIGYPGQSNSAIPRFEVLLFRRQLTRA